MRKFRFVGNPKMYDYWDLLPVFGEIYSGKDYNSMRDQSENLSDDVISRFDDWEEVFETVLNHQNQFTTDGKLLHKETYLGYYAGLAMQGLCANGKFTEGIAYSPCLSELSVSIAKELIKQLNEENNG